MRTKDEKLHERRKAEILTAATKCFSERGIRQTTMREICSAVEISPGALYRYYPSKDDIILALAEMERAENDELIAYLNSKKDVLKALREAMPEIIKEITKPDIARLTMEIGAEAARNADVAAPFIASEKKFKSDLIEALTRGQKNGFVDPSVDIRAFVHLFVNMLEGISGSFAFPTDVSIRKLTKSLDQVIHRTLSPKRR